MTARYDTPSPEWYEPADLVDDDDGQVATCLGCGDTFEPDEPVCYDGMPEATYHKHCADEAGVLRCYELPVQMPLRTTITSAHMAPTGTLIRCTADCTIYGTAGEGRLVVGVDEIFYVLLPGSNDFPNTWATPLYEPYHPACAPVD